MNKISDTVKSFLLGGDISEYLSSDLLNWIKEKRQHRDQFYYIQNIINSYSYHNCHILTYWLLEQIPEINVAVFFGVNSERPAHSALVLPSGFFFDAQGFRSEEKVYEQYRPICQEHRDEDLLPAQIMNREKLIETMIRVTKSFNSRKDVEGSFQMRKGSVFSDINDFFDLIGQHRKDKCQ